MTLIIKIFRNTAYSKYSAFLFLALAFLVVGCVENTDLESPITSIISPTNGDTLLVDEGLRITATIEDNDLLSEYRIRLEGVDGLNGLIADSTIERVFIDALGKDEFYIEQTFDIPDSLMSAYYKLSMTALDNAGNESVQDTSLLYFLNSNDTIHPTFIDTMIFDTISVIRGGFHVNIDVFDDYLKYVKLEVTEVNGPTALREVEWLNVNYSWVNIFEWYQFDETWPEGDYSIHVIAVDKYGYREFYNTIYIDQ